MRVVGLKEFMALPAGTVFEETERTSSAHGEIRIKGQNMSSGYDWSEAMLGGDLTISGAGGGGMDGWFALTNTPGKSLPYDPHSYARNGMFPEPEDGNHFLIYEPDDIAKMILALAESLRTQMTASGSKMTLLIDQFCEPNDADRDMLSGVLAALPKTGLEKED